MIDIFMWLSSYEVTSDSMIFFLYTTQLKALKNRETNFESYSKEVTKLRSCLVSILRDDCVYDTFLEYVMQPKSFE